MLLEFSVGNFGCFKEVVTIDLRASKLKAQFDDVDSKNTVTLEHRANVLKIAAVYGANGSGKSTLIRAFLIFYRLIEQSFEKVEKPDFSHSFSTETVDKPSFYQLIFVIDGVEFRYGCEIDDQAVHSEWLFRKKKREVPIFIREGSRLLEVADSYIESSKAIFKRTRKDALFLTVLSLFDVSIATQLTAYFKEHYRIIDGLDDTFYHEVSLDLLEGSSLSDKMINLVSQADVGISGMEVYRATSGTDNEANPDSKEKWVLTRHPIFDKDNRQTETEAVLALHLHGSAGTRKLFALSGPLLYVLEYGCTLWVDEMDARVHPALTLELIKLFQNPKTNPKSAQLIFTTHDTNLLRNDLFRRDQIWFTEKDRYGASTLYSLADLKVNESSVRNDESYEKNYIRGRYGGIPYLGDFTWQTSTLNESQTTQKG